MYCRHVDDFLYEAHGQFELTDVILSGTLLALAAPLVLCGEYTFKPIAASLAALSTFVVSFVLTRDRVDCDWRMGISLVVAASFFTMTLCILKFAIFTIGAVGVGGLSYFLVEPFSIDVVAKVSVVGGCGVVGGIAAYLKRNLFLRFLSSLCGGVLVSFAIDNLWDTNEWVFLPVASAIAMAGTLFQSRPKRNS